MEHVDSSDARGLERFLKLTVERRGILPSSIFLSGVRRIGRNFEHGGGFADVWKGEYENNIVALKVLRLFCFADKERMQLVSIPNLHVIPSDFCPCYGITGIHQRGFALEETCSP